MRDLRGQETAPWVLEIAAAGRHNLLMVGPPDAGKSMLSVGLSGLLPPLSPREALDVTMLHSIAGQLPSGGLIQTRPFRDPHHSASMAALVGGGAHAKPGEISLSHRGVLFLDELAEFAKPVLDALRQPLETGSIVVARANHHVTYPAEFQLIAAMNPCRCGYLGDPARACPRALACGRAYCCNPHLPNPAQPSPRESVMWRRLRISFQCHQLNARLMRTAACHPKTCRPQPASCWNWRLKSRP